MNARSSVVSMMAAATLTLAASIAQGQTTANGPYYATPSWDQQLPASTRFIVLSNWGSAAVLDRETGLVWEKAPSTSPPNWFFASVHCLNLNLGGRTGWRLPALPEFMSLMDRSQSNPSLPSGHPFTVQVNVYWSATTVVSNTAQAWVVGLGDGAFGPDDKLSSQLAWCVRGGAGGDAQ